jgi:arylsulfate sulfotransferase
MKLRLALPAALLTLSASLAFATQATDTTITIAATSPGVTPFIAQLALNASDTSVIDSIEFSIKPKAGSVTRPFSQTYSASYLTSHAYLQPATGEIFLPVYGLYASYTNKVTLTYRFLDGSSKSATTLVTAPAFADPCGIAHPLVVQPRTATKALSYDYMLVRGGCGGANGVSPVIVDTDGAVRWTCPLAADAVRTAACTFFDHAVYVTRGSILYRVDLDGTVTSLADYSGMGVINFHHNIDMGRTGMILDVDSTTYLESENMEVDGTGKLLKKWNSATIISKAMTAGGDDPDQFVYPTPDDWWHNNATAYRKSTDSLIISSRENLVMDIDYDKATINWLLGDKTKKWYQFNSLKPFALDVSAGTHPPIGQHAVSITADDRLLLFDNGLGGAFQTPPGLSRTYSSPRKYDLDLTNRVATEVWNYESNQSIYSQVCSSVYEDAPLNYLIDYAYISSLGPDLLAQLVGVAATGERVFAYQYPSNGCNTAYNSLPLHAEQFLLTDAGQTLNISTRGTVAGGDNVLVAGFIVTGFDPKDVVLRALGPSLSGDGVSGALSDPVLTLYDSTGAVIASNDNWASGSDAGELTAQELAPTNPNEAAIVQRLTPGSYTVVISGQGGARGAALVEAYDLSQNSNSTLSNISTRGLVGSGDEVLISGFIIGPRNNETAVIRAIGPSLTAAGVTGALSDSVVTLYNSNGDLLARNDNWANDPNADFLRSHYLAPVDPRESALVVSLLPGSYTAVVAGTHGATGVGLVEVYNLP